MSIHQSKILFNKLEKLCNKIECAGGPEERRFFKERLAAEMEKGGYMIEWLRERAMKNCAGNEISAADVTLYVPETMQGRVELWIYINELTVIVGESIKDGKWWQRRWRLAEKNQFCEVGTCSHVLSRLYGKSDTKEPGSQKELPANTSVCAEERKARDDNDRDEKCNEIASRFESRSESNVRRDRQREHA